MLIIKQRQLDLAASREVKAQEDLINEINDMNAPIILSPNKKSKALTRDDILGDYDDLIDELTEELDDEENLDDTLENEELDELFDLDPSEELAYVHCGCHNVNLVVGDGMDKLNDDFVILLKKVTKDIVGKSKMSSIIAEELRKIDIKLCRHCKTRWSTYLFVTS